MTESVLQPSPTTAPTTTAPPKPAALPSVPTAYPHFLRTPRARWWKGLLAILSLIVGFLVLSIVFSFAAVAIDIVTGRTDPNAIGSGAIAFTPMLFLANNLALAALLPLSMLLQWAFYGQRPGWLSSVTGRFRWRWFGRAAIVITPIWLVYVTVMYLVDPSYLSRLSADAAVMLVVVALTTPFQAAGEEYGARGLINRAAGSWFASPRAALVVGLLVSSTVFMLAHGSNDPWLLVYYFVFGAVLAVLAWRTGGLEVPVLVHVVNNVFIMIPSALFGDLSQAFERGFGVGSPIMLVPMVLLIALIPLTEWWTRRNRIERAGAGSHA